MAAKIEVEKIDLSKFRVRIIETGSETIHDVTVTPNVSVTYNPAPKSTGACA